MSLTPMTELEAVNLMLSTIGETPVNSLDTAGLADASLAKRLLDQSNRDVQLHGWHWNTEENYPITPNEDQYLILPANTLKVDTTGYDGEFDLVQRGNRLYDRWNHTYEFSREVRVEIVLLLPFEELPEAARYYIFIRAARRFQQHVVGSEVLDAYTREDEFKALAMLRSAEFDNQDHNIFSDNWTVARVLARETYGRSVIDSLPGKSSPAVPPVLDPDVVEIN